MNKKFGLLPGYKLTAIKLSVVGAGHAHDEEAKSGIAAQISRVWPAPTVILSLT
jgi:hypothetical protein